MGQIVRLADIIARLSELRLAVIEDAEGGDGALAIARALQQVAAEVAGHGQ